MEQLAALLSQKSLDANSKFKIMDMLDERPTETMGALDPVRNRFEEWHVGALLDEECDFFVWDNLFGETADEIEQTQSLLAKARAEGLAMKPLMREAGFGGGTPAAYQQPLQKNKAVRSDLLIWLTYLLKESSPGAEGQLSTENNPSLQELAKFHKQLFLAATSHEV